MSVTANENIKSVKIHQSAQISDSENLRYCESAWWRNKSGK